MGLFYIPNNTILFWPKLIIAKIPIKQFRFKRLPYQLSWCQMAFMFNVITSTHHLMRHDLLVSEDFLNFDCRPCRTTLSMVILNEDWSVFLCIYLITFKYNFLYQTHSSKLQRRLQMYTWEIMWLMLCTRCLMKMVTRIYWVGAVEQD